MRQELNFWVIGGDMRQVRLAGLLAADGHSVHTFALEQGERAEQVKEEATLREAALADCVILPLPVEAESGMLNAPLSAGRYSLSQVLGALRSGQVICGGRVSREAAALAEERGLVLRDYFLREELAVANAVPNAWGILQRKRAFHPPNGICSPENGRRAAPWKKERPWNGS
ncbi:dipicolinate synthase subunit A N-terminal domain-containing protein [uncultured Pseudoflavonifractor sp.]|uniref:dipicolinate synthase subunit A N-terminal domain-containing protein n=1 Tax=uncultured Pseudoflavonifractor sp. TaxID=1221379 RepID=UPI0025DCC932|nr:dipicolinate synthase subunit A N-terminal domain-containing protein [uncultured Pseudoflavonifractor sp.]